MDDNLRVTVVLTGLNKVKKEYLKRRKLESAENTKNDGKINYEELEKPTVMRNQNKKDSRGSFGYDQHRNCYKSIWERKRCY